MITFDLIQHPACEISRDQMAPETKRQKNLQYGCAHLNTHIEQEVEDEEDSFQILTSIFIDDLFDNPENISQF